MRKISLFLIVFLATGFLGSIGGTSTVSNQHEMVYVSAEQQKMSTIISKTDETLQIKKQLHNEQVNCMAKNIFFEAAVESTAGKLAVAQVTLNRVNSTWYPNTVCEVVYEGPTYTARDGQQLPKRDRCQFSWYCDGKDDEPREDSRLWIDIQELAKYVLLRQDELPDITDGALNYHADYIAAPRWAGRKLKTAKIDTHIFYRPRTLRL
jgi:N-acetylmuramoyl-L-alanine amidase